MASTIPPAREAQFVPWLTNFHDRVVAEVDHFGVPASIVTSYTTAYNAFMAAYASAVDPQTRTKSAIQAKDTAKVEILAQTRHVMGVIQAMPTVTDAQRVLLGLHIRDVEPTPIPAPNHAPQLSVVSVINRTVRIKLQDATEWIHRFEWRGRAARRRVERCAASVVALSPRVHHRVIARRHCARAAIARLARFRAAQFAG